MAYATSQPLLSEAIASSGSPWHWHGQTLVNPRYYFSSIHYFYVDYCIRCDDTKAMLLMEPATERHAWVGGVVGYRICLTHRRSSVRTWADSCDISLFAFFLVSTVDAVKVKTNLS